MRRYPHNRLADDARQAITELKQQAQAEKVAGAQKAAETKLQEKSGNAKDTKDAGDGSVAIAESAGTSLPSRAPGVCRGLPASGTGLLPTTRGLLLTWKAT